MQSITTSIRLLPSLRKKLEKTAHALHRGKNWIISQALEEYLAKLNQNDLAKEARRQSLVAAKAESKENQLWETAADTGGWE